MKTAVVLLIFALVIGGIVHLGCREPKVHEMQQWEVRFQSGRCDTLFRDDWSGRWYKDGHSVWIDHTETIRRIK